MYMSKLYFSCKKLKFDINIYLVLEILLVSKKRNITDPLPSTAQNLQKQIK